LKIEANEEQIRNFLNTAHKLFSARIPAIKFVRFLTGCPLKEAKDLVDSCSIVYDNRPWPEGGNDW
jgi:ribosomal protein L7/L12